MSHPSRTQDLQATAPVQWRFALIFLIVLSPLISWPSAIAQHPVAELPWWTFWVPLLSIHCIVPFLDGLLPPDSNPAVSGKTSPINKLIPLLCVPCWYAALFASAYCLSQILSNALVFDWRVFSLIAGLVLSLGAIGGILAINPAHELIHRASRFERSAGGVLLAGVCYGAFKTEHVRGHHLHVGTERDTASALKGDSVFSFAPASFLGTVKNAIAIENERLSRMGVKSFTWQWFTGHEVLRLNAVSIGTALLLYVIWGWPALALFVMASLIAITELEVINYIEHYGLRRQKIASRYEPVQEHHSWNANSQASNAFLFNLQRHSDHHAHAGKDYLHLASVTSAPQLPYGYGLMFLIALVPPLWRRIMDHRVP